MEPRTRKMLLTMPAGTLLRAYEEVKRSGAGSLTLRARALRVLRRRLVRAVRPHVFAARLHARDGDLLRRSLDLLLDADQHGRDVVFAAVLVRPGDELRARVADVRVRHDDLLDLVVLDHP